MSGAERESPPPCSACRTPSSPGARFCARCGRPLGALGALESDQPLPAEERKPVTVVFVDLVGSTSLAEQLDVEQTRQVLSDYHHCARRVFERFGGTVEKFIGDAVVAVFGAPRTHEDDAERAVRAALAVRDAVRGLPHGLAVRIGVNTGEALVVLTARPELGEAMIAGDAVNIAARLQTAAAEGAILVGESTYRLTRPHARYLDHAPVPAKGRSTPIACHRLVCLDGDGRSAQRPPRTAGSTMIGRERELAALHEAWQLCRANRTPVAVTVIGPPGIGKTRLVEEFRAHQVSPDAEPSTWFGVQVAPYGPGAGTLALADAVVRACGIPVGVAPETVAAVVDADLEARGASAGDRAWLRPQLLSLLGIRPAVGVGSALESYTAWTAFLELLAGTVPQIVLVEDLHWADETLRGFIDHLIARSADAPRLVLCTTRPEYEPHSDDAGASGRRIRLTLDPLSPADVRSVVGELVNDTILPSEVGEAIVDRSGGVPLFAHEYLRSLLDQGHALTVPDSVRGVIGGRIDALPAPEKALLLDLAVLGEQVPTTALTALGRPEPAAELLNSLHRRQFLDLDPRQARIRFTHALIGEVAHDRLTRSERFRRHRAIADWLERRSDPTAIELAAAHWDRATSNSPAASGSADDRRLRRHTAHALCRAGRLAVARGDQAAAVGHAESALAVLDPLAPAEESTETEVITALRAELSVLAATSRAALGRGDREELVRARDAALAVGRIEDALQVWEAIYLLALETADGDQLARVIDQAVALAESAPVGPHAARALNMRVFALIADGEHRAAATYAARHIARADEAGEPVVAAGLRCHEAMARLQLGEIDALAEMERASQLIAATDPAGTVAVVLGNLADSAIAAGAIHSAAGWADQALEAARRSGERTPLQFARLLRAHVAHHLGEDVAAVLGEPRRPAGSSLEHHQLVQLALSTVESDPQMALATADDALAWARQAGDPDLASEALALRCLAAEGLGRLDDAVASAGDLIAQTPRYRAFSGGPQLARTAPTLVRAGRADLLDDACAALVDTPWRAAIADLAAGRPAAAADILDRIECRPLARTVRRLITQPPTPPGTGRTSPGTADPAGSGPIPRG